MPVNASDAHASDVLFWTCPIREHTAVRWEGAQAKCLECPMTSMHTEKLVSRGRAEQRSRDIRHLKGLARKIRMARMPGSTIPAESLPLVPARVLDTVAELLAGAPIGDLGDD